MLRFEAKSGEDKELNIDFSEAGTVSGTIHAPAEGDEVWLSLTLEGRGEAAGVQHRAQWHGKNPFKFGAVFPGKYALSPVAYWKNRVGRPNNNAKVTTDPPEIIVEVKPKGNVTQDITITKIEERE